MMAAVVLLWASSAFGYSGATGVWGFKPGDFILKNHPGTDAGLLAADAYMSPTGFMQIGPGGEGLSLPAYRSGACWIWQRYDAYRVIGTPFEAWPGGVRRFRADSTGIDVTGKAVVSDSIRTPRIMATDGILARLGPASSPTTGGAIRIVDGVTFPLTGEGVQAALDEVDAVGSGWVQLPQGTIPYDSLRIPANVTLAGAGMNATTLSLRSTHTFQGPTIRDKSAAEGNSSGATGLWIRDLKVVASNTPGAGINLGNQAGAAQMNINAGLDHVYVQGFVAGVGIEVNGNATYMNHVWANSNDIGFKLSSGGGSNKIFGLWAEGNDSIQIQVDASNNSFIGVHCEETTATDKGPTIELKKENNTFTGVDISVNQNRSNLIVLRTGLSGRNQFYGLRVLANGGAWTNTYYSDAFGSGTGNTAFIPALVENDPSFPIRYRNPSTNAYSTIAGVDWIGGGKGTFADSLHVMRRAMLEDTLRVLGPGDFNNSIDVQGKGVFGDSLRVPKGLYVGGQFVNKILRASATLDFDLTALTVHDLTISVPGAALGNEVFVGAPWGSMTTTVTYFGVVSAAGTVTVRARVATAGENPASGTFNVAVFQ